MRKKIVSLFMITIIIITSFSVFAAKDITYLPIVMYHHLSKNSKMLGGYVLSVNQFEKDLIYLKENGYNTITATQLIDYSKGKSLPKKPCMITFDDGFESIYVYALPLLKKYNMKATVFIHGYVIDQYTAVNDHNIDYSYMNWGIIKELNKNNNIDIEYHTYDMHKLYPRRGAAKLATESYEAYNKALSEDIKIFNEKLKQNINKTATAAALPFGEYSDETIKIFKDNGFLSIYTCTEVVNIITKTDDLPLLGRYNRSSGKDSEQFFNKWQ